MSGTINFTIGEDLDIILGNIVHDKIYDGDLKGAIRTYKESLIGINEDLIKQLILGERVLSVDVDTQEIVVTKRPVDFDRYRLFDIEQWLERKERSNNETFDAYSNFYRTTDWKSARRTDKNINWDTVKEKLRNGDTIDYDMFDERPSFYIESVQKVRSVLEDFDEFKDTAYKLITFFGNESLFVDTENHMKLLVLYRNDLKDGDEELSPEKSLVDNYINSMQENDDVLEEGLKPVDITKGYNAGWLSPDGDYYGLNGEMANMLHNTISDGLVELGIIPKKDDMDMEVNPDSWLEQAGWVKLHNEWVLYDGYNQPKRKLPIIPLTEIQRKKIYEYGQIVHLGRLKIGFKMEWMSAARFQMTNDIQMRKLFEY